MAIPEEDVAKVRAATDLVALIGEQTSLKRVGRRFVGLCPFHGEKTPSFSVNAEEGLYYCFGCQASGDAISFVRAMEGCDFVEAVERLAARAGVHVRNDAGASGDAARGRRQALYEAFEAAAEFYHQYLLSNAEAGRARQYLRARGYDGEVVRRYRIGFAPASYDSLVQHLKIQKSVLLDAGLAYESSERRPRDAFRERVMFPISDPGNRVIAFGGRVLPEQYRKLTRDPGPKYRNSPESSIYQKRSTLYGLNFSKAEITARNEAVVCEGYTDVIGFAMAGIARAVATCGTALTEDHFRLLSRFARRIVLCFDADNAGQNAAARLYDWERRHELELAVASLPAGSDPAELARSDPKALQDAIVNARPFLGFRIERALAAQNLRTPEGRTRAAEAAIAAIAEHPNELVRDQYLIEVADHTRHAPAQLRELLERARGEQGASGNGASTASHAPAPAPARPARPRGARLSAVSRDALALAIHRPAEVAPLLSEVLFSEPLERDAYLALANETSLHEAIAHADPDAAAVLSELAVSDDASEIDLEGTFVALVRNAGTRALADIESELRRLPADDEQALADASATTRWLKEQLEALRDPVLRNGQVALALDAAQRLLAWLTTRLELEPER